MTRNHVRIALLVFAAALLVARLVFGREPSVDGRGTSACPPLVYQLAPGVTYEASPVTGSAVWVREEISLARIEGDGERGNWFADPNLPPAMRVFDSDYVGSLFDRGHLAAAGNQGGAGEKADTFNLSNAAPQVPAINRGEIRWLEETLRRRVAADPKQLTEIVVVTAPLYEYRRQPPRWIGARHVLVPTAFAKCVIVLVANKPTQGQAWRIANTAGATAQLVTIDEVETWLQRDLFAELPDDIEAHLESGL